MAVNSAYLEALKLLARRELSESQVRHRLARKGHAADEVDAAVTRLSAERAIDDARVAEAIARTETSLKRRGKMRVKAAIERAGVAGATARRAIDEVLGAVDSDALLEAVLTKRLRGRDRISDERELQRLYRHLVGQGFESDRVLAALKRHKKQ